MVHKLFLFELEIYQQVSKVKIIGLDMFMLLILV